MCEDIGGCVGLYGAVGACVGLYGAVRAYVGLYGHFLGCGVIWGWGICMGLYGAVWVCVGLCAWGAVWDWAVFMGQCGALCSRSSIGPEPCGAACTEQPAAIQGCTGLGRGCSGQRPYRGRASTGGGIQHIQGAVGTTQHTQGAL